MFDNRETFGEKAYAVFGVVAILGVTGVHVVANVVIGSLALSNPDLTVLQMIAVGLTLAVGMLTIQISTMKTIFELLEKFDPINEDADRDEIQE